MLKDRILYVACFGFGAGVLWRSLFRADLYTALCIGLVYIVLTLFFSFVLKKNWDVLISVFVLAFLLGILRFHMADMPPPQVFETQVGQNISVSGLIVDEPAKSGSDVKLMLRTNAEGPKTGIVIFAKQDPPAGEASEGYRYGDEIEVTGTLEKPKNFMTDQGLEFDYANYLRKDGMFYTMRNPTIEIVSSGNGNFLKRALFSAKERFDATLASAIPVPESVVMRGIILGERSLFSQSLRQSFMDTGTIHVVTIGGYHVTLVAQWIMKILGSLPMPYASAAGIVSVFLYVIVTGGAQTSIRAGIMATLVIVAGVTGRIYAAGRALILAATVMILINPFVLAYDISFELSFMATIAIIFLSPRIKPYVQWIPWKWLRDIVAITCAMYVFALPFILYRMGNLSLVALPANILIVPLMPVTMIMGFITGFAGLVSPILAFIPGRIAYALLYYQITAIGILAHLPFAALAIPYFPLALVLLIYAIFFWIFFTGYGHMKAPQSSRLPKRFDSRFFMLMVPLLLTLVAAGFFYYDHSRSQQAARMQLQELLGAAAAGGPASVFMPDERTISSGCKVQGPFPDHACTPGALFEYATVEDICVPGYTKTVRNVSTNLRQHVFAEYDMAYPQPSGAYEVDHLVPLALGGSNDIANLFPEAAEPIPGFHEKDVVEVFLQHEVCAGRVFLPAAQRQISTDWLAVYNTMTFEEIQAIKKRYGGDANQ